MDPAQPIMQLAQPMLLYVADVAAVMTDFAWQICRICKEPEDPGNSDYKCIAPCMCADSPTDMTLKNTWVHKARVLAHACTHAHAYTSSFVWTRVYAHACTAQAYMHVATRTINPHVYIHMSVHMSIHMSIHMCTHKSTQDAPVCSPALASPGHAHRTVRVHWAWVTYSPVSRTPGVSNILVITITDILFQ